MARNRTDYSRKYKTESEMVAETPEVFESFYVREKDLHVRIRTAPRIDSDFTGNYLGDGLHEIVRVENGEGSKSGWGWLASGVGWVALDYLEKVSK